MKRGHSHRLESNLRSKYNKKESVSLQNQFSAFCLASTAIALVRGVRKQAMRCLPVINESNRVNKVRFELSTGAFHLRLALYANNFVRGSIQTEAGTLT
jgi:hypothetical protein